MPVPVTLKVRPAGESPGPVIERRSEPGLFHRFRADGLEAAKPWQYSLSVEAPPYRLVGKAYPVRLLPGGDRLRFVVFGDCRSRTKEWAAVAEAVRQSKPDLVVFTGDMTECGRHDWLWQEHFFGPAAELFATVPFYPVIGNHEENAPVYPLLFHTPSPDGLATDWAQEIAAVLIVGFDGQWSPTWDRQKKPWLRKVLADSPAKFIFVATHYPAYSSSGNGTLDPKTGQPRHWAYRNGREFVLPLLARHQAAAMITSHEHHYERSEVPQGLTQIISGGAGAPLSGKVPQADKQNPYAKVFLQTLHYCLIEVQGHQARCRALTPEGKEIDLVTWKARAGR
jgi:hypothetical protein